MRLTLLVALFAGLTGVNIVLFVASTRQFVDAMAERAAVETILVQIRNLLADCPRHAP